MNHIPVITDAQIEKARTEKGWTNLRVNVALGLFARGLSDSQIAAEIQHVTRNAVIGLRYRKGIFVGKVVDRPKLRNANNTPAGESKEQREARRLSAAFKRPKAVKIEHAPPPPSIDDAAIPMDQRRQLSDLGNDHCRWPVGEPGRAGFFFCGGPVTTHPYCVAHARRSIDRTSNLDGGRR